MGKGPLKITMNWVIFDDPCNMDSFKLSVKEATSTTNVSIKQKVPGFFFSEVLEGPFKGPSDDALWYEPGGTPPCIPSFRRFFNHGNHLSMGKKARSFLIKKPWFRRPTNLNWWVYRISGCHQQYVNPPGRELTPPPCPTCTLRPKFRPPKKLERKQVRQTGPKHYPWKLGKSYTTTTSHSLRGGCSSGS